MESTISSMECTLSTIKNTLPTLDSTLSILKSSVSLMDNAITQIKKAIPSLESSISTLKTEIKSKTNPDKKEIKKEIILNKKVEKKPLKKTRTLNNGLEMPLIGLGSSRISNIVDVVYNSIKDGLRLIDTAFKYGNEAEIGEGLKKALNDNLCKREDLFIIGKIWIDDRRDPEAALKRTLQKLQLDYIDLYLDHWPSGNNHANPDAPKQVPIFEFWPKMEELVDKGLTKSIGCSNYNVQSLLNLLSFCRIKPVANEVEFHPYYYQKGLKDFCDKENIALIAYYPLAKGNGAKTYIKEHNGEMDIFKERVVEDLVEKYNKTPGQIILNWHAVQGVIAIPGTSNPNRFKENLKALDFQIDEDEVEKLGKFGKKMKFCGCRRFFGYNIMA